MNQKTKERIARGIRKYVSASRIVLNGERYTVADLRLVCSAESRCGEPTCPFCAMRMLTTDELMAAQGFDQPVFRCVNCGNVTINDDGLCDPCIDDAGGIQ